MHKLHQVTPDRVARSIYPPQLRPVNSLTRCLNCASALSVQRIFLPLLVKLRKRVSTACSSCWFIASSGFKARCAPPALASCPGGLIVANQQCAFGRHRLLLVSRSEALQWPDSWPPTTASADFCGFTPCITAGRTVWSDGSGPVRSLEIGLLDLAPGHVRYGTTQPSLPSAPHRQGAQISPGRCANCRYTSAVFTVGHRTGGPLLPCAIANSIPRP